MLEKITREMFEQQSGTVFKVTADSGRLDFKLAVVRQLSANPNSFSLLFEGPLTPMLNQKIYCFNHEVLGTFDLFIVPVGKTDEAIKYEAIINRLPK